MSASGSITSFVFIKSSADAHFAVMSMELGELAGTMLDRACSKYTHWRLNALEMNLFLVAKAGVSMPQLLAPDTFKDLEPLSVDVTLESAGVSSGAWLVAVPTTPASSSSSGISIGQFNIADAFAALDAKISTVVQQVKTEDYVFSSAPSSAVNKLMAARQIREHNFALPPIAHLMPPLHSLVPFFWGTSREATASPSLLKLLERWVKTDTASPPENVFRDVQTLASHSPLEVSEPGIGRFRGVPDLAILCQGCNADSIIPLSNCAAAVDWKTTTALLGNVTAQALLQSMGLREISGGGASSPPVFFTDLASHFLCCRMVKEDMHYYVGADGRKLSLEEGVGLLRHFLLLDKEREMAYLSNLNTFTAVDGKEMPSVLGGRDSKISHLGGKGDIERDSMRGGGELGGSSTTGPRECLENWDLFYDADSCEPHCGSADNISVADAQAIHIAELQSITIALTHQLTAHGGICRKDFCVKEED
jgi:hypothetical protein